MHKTAAIAVFAVAAPFAANAADSFYATYIAERNGEAPCYARTYDAKHLAANPKQRVTRFYVIHSSAEHLEPPDSFDVVLGYQLRGVDDSYVSEAGCAAENEVILCSVEGDAGYFKLSPNGEGLRVTIDDRLHLEGSVSFSPDLAEGGDDRVLLLHPGPAEACDFDTSADAQPAIDPLAPQLSRPTYRDQGSG